jgi:CubicO group peptidase (beta-lactamase class C family)
MCPTNLETVFNSFSVTKAISATAILMMVEDGLIDLKKPVSYYWPEFGKNGKESITVNDVMNHRSGLQNAGTTELAEDPLLVCDNDKMIKLVEDTIPENIGKTAYHYLSFGWILQGLTKKVTGMYLDEYVQNKIANKIGINEEFSIGTSKRNNVANLVLKRFEMPEQKKDETNADVNGKRPSFKPSLLLNPTFFNNPKIMSASIPSANGFFSAQALAKFYSSIVSSDGVFASRKEGVLYYIKSDNDEQIESIKSEMVQGGDAIFKLGFQVYSNDDDYIYFGHNGLGGSIAMTAINKKTGENIQIAITLNRLNIDAKVTRQIMRKIFNELKMKTPSNFLRD